MEAADTHHGTAFQWKACLFIDLARIVSAFFLPYFLSTPTFLLSFSFFFILQLPLTQGSCLFTMYVRQSSGEGTALVRLECTGWNGTQKGTLFYLMTMVYGCIAIRQKRTTTPPKSTWCELLHKGHGKVVRTGKRSWWCLLFI